MECLANGRQMSKCLMAEEPLPRQLKWISALSRKNLRWAFMEGKTAPELSRKTFFNLYATLSGDLADLIVGSSFLHSNPVAFFIHFWAGCEGS